LEGTTLEMWIVYGWLRGLDRPVYLALGGAFLAWLLAFRGIQPGPQLALALGLWALLEGRRRFIESRSLRAALWPLAACGAVGLLGFCFAGVRMVPVLDSVLAHQRVVKESALRLVSEVFVEIYAVPVETRGFGAPGYAYVGWTTFLLFIGAALF